MNTHADKIQVNKSQSMVNAVSQKYSGGVSTFQLVDNRSEAIAQRKLQEMANNSPQVKQAAQFQAMVDNHSVQQQHSLQKKENNIVSSGFKKEGNAPIQRMAILMGNRDEFDNKPKKDGSFHDRRKQMIAAANKVGKASPIWWIMKPAFVIQSIKSGIINVREDIDLFGHSSGQNTLGGIDDNALSQLILNNELTEKVPENWRGSIRIFSCFGGDNTFVDDKGVVTNREPFNVKLARTFSASRPGIKAVAGSTNQVNIGTSESSSANGVGPINGWGVKKQKRVAWNVATKGEDDVWNSVDKPIRGDQPGQISNDKYSK